MQTYCVIGSTQRPDGNRKPPIHSHLFAWPLSKPTTAVRMTQEEERHLAPGETRRRDLSDLQTMSNGRWMGAWSSLGSRLQRETDHGHPPREGNKRSSRVLRRLVQAWRREVGRRMLPSWTRHRDTEGQSDGRMLEVEAGMLSEGCSSAWPWCHFSVSHVIVHPLVPQHHVPGGRHAYPLSPV